SRRGVETAERFADGEASRAELDVAALRARAAADEMVGRAPLSAARAAAWIAADEALDAVERVAWAAAEEVLCPDGRKLARWESELQEEANRQERLLWDLMEDVLWPGGVVVLSDWRTPTVLGLAARVYDTRDFALLPVLADALEDAGCAD